MIRSETTVSSQFRLSESVFIDLQDVARESSLALVGTQVWRASLLLADVCADETAFSRLVGTVSVDTALELGAGIGLVSIVALLSGRVRHMIATDGSRAVCRGLKKNLQHNCGRSSRKSGKGSEKSVVGTFDVQVCLRRRA